MWTTREKSGRDPISAEKSCGWASISLRSVVLTFFLASILLALFSALKKDTRPSWRVDPTRFMAPVFDPRWGNFDSGTSPTNISHIVFGIGGSTETWKNRKHYSELWWKPNVTRGFVWLEKDPNPDPDNPWPENSIPYRVSSDWRGFKYSSSPSAVRIARVVVDLFREGLPDVRWFVMGDDDTVFFTENLVTVLGKYDHRRMHYVGMNSESVEQNVRHAYDMAFGGGGFAISYPLAAELVRIMDGCLRRYFFFYGSDQRVWACVGEIGVSLTKEPGFHQMDIRGDPYGLLAAHPMAPLVSLHHLDDANPIFPNHNHLESVRTLIGASQVDPGRTLQQCFCYHRKNKWSISISWGYSVQIYPAYFTAKELETPLQTFRTWRSWKDGPFTFNTRSVSLDPCVKPVVFFLDSVFEDGRGGSVSTYKKFVVKLENSKKCRKRDHRDVAVDSIVISAPKMDSKNWKENRRHCCEIKRSSKRGTMKVSIRKCENWESVTV